jgi:hypothetical protein
VVAQVAARLGDEVILQGQPGVNRVAVKLPLR